MVSQGLTPDKQSAEIVMRAKRDLAGRRGIPINSITLRHIQAVDWPDSSLGTAEPGRAYAQVIIPGYRILLSDGTYTYEYHTDSFEKAVFCGVTGG